MVKEGEYIDYMANLPDFIEGDTTFSACKDLAVKVKELEAENKKLKVRLQIIEERLNI